MSYETCKHEHKVFSIGKLFSYLTGLPFPIISVGRGRLRGSEMDRERPPAARPGLGVDAGARVVVFCFGSDRASRNDDLICLASSIKSNFSVLFSTLD